MNVINTNFIEYREYNTLLADIIAHAHPNLDLLTKLSVMVYTSSSSYKTVFGIVMPKHNNMVWLAVSELNKPYIIIERKEPMTTSAYSLDSVDELKLINRLLNGFLLEMGYEYDKAPQVVSTLLSIYKFIK